MEEFTSFICFRLGSATRKIQRFYNNLYKQHGITLGQSFILFALMEKEGLSLGGMADKLNLDNSAITGLIDRMESDNLLFRKVDPEDRRSFLIYMSEKGRNLANTIYPLANSFNQKLKGSLNNEEQKILDKMLSSLDQIIDY